MEQKEQNTGKKVLIETWGCQMNVADSEHMLKLLKDQQFSPTNIESDADLIILNTCHIREKAKHKVLSRLGRLNQLKENNPNLTIAVAGCVAQAEGKKLIKAAPQIDILLGPGKIADLPELLDRFSKNRKPEMALGFHRERQSEDHVSKVVPPTLTGKNEVTRYVNIIQGCNNFCTFCVVPYTRGKEISRLPKDILDESRRFLDSGAKEICLLGQNVNSYGLDLAESGLITPSANGSFVDLLQQMLQLEGIERLRFTTSNPHDFTIPLAQLFAINPKMGRYIHLPVQSGNNRTLERMKRKVTVEEYLERIHWLQSIDPNMAISSDIIVGFPGETEEEFEDTLSLLRNVRFGFVFAFKYSPRPNTAAARFREQIPETEKDRRLAKLLQLQDQITLEIHNQEVGSTRELLITYESKKNPGQFYGRTEHFRLVRVRANRDIVGQTLKVKITAANKTALDGELI